MLSFLPIQRKLSPYKPLSELSPPSPTVDELDCAISQKICAGVSAVDGQIYNCDVHCCGFLLRCLQVKKKKLKYKMR